MIVQIILEHLTTLFQHCRITEVYKSTNDDGTKQCIQVWLVRLGYPTDPLVNMLVEKSTCESLEFIANGEVRQKTRIGGNNLQKNNVMKTAQTLGKLASSMIDQTEKFSSLRKGERKLNSSELDRIPGCVKANKSFNKPSESSSCS